MKRFVLYALLFAALSACGTRPPAPVVDRSPYPEPVTRAPIYMPPPQPVPQPAQPPVTTTIHDQHIARSGETLYTIARAYGIAPRDLAQWNGIPMDFDLREGQILRLTPPATVLGTPLPQPAPIPSTPVPIAPSGDVKREPKALKVPYSDEAMMRFKGSAVPRASTAAPVGSAQAATLPQANPSPTVVAPPDADNISWQWPVAGRVVKKFSDNAVMKGVAIDTRVGTPVLAAAAGRVVYAGEGLRGYGKLVIIRHNESVTSVYGHNSVILVKDGESVKRGQKIAESGDSEADAPRVHFEVRRSGKPVDPERVLPAR